MRVQAFDVSSRLRLTQESRVLVLGTAAQDVIPTLQVRLPADYNEEGQPTDRANKPLRHSIQSACSALCTYCSWKFHVAVTASKPAQRNRDAQVPQWLSLNC